MKRASTLFLRAAIFLMGAGVLIVCILGWLSLIWTPVGPEEVWIIYPLLTGVTLAAIPFVAALYQGIQLLNYIDHAQAFSPQSIRALKNIKVCALIVGGLFTAILPFVAQVAQLDDAPGLMVVGMFPIFVSIIMAVFAAVLERLLQEAIDIKTENDLIV